MLNDIYLYVAAHKPFIGLAFTWLAKEIVTSNPYIQAHGGLLRVVRDFLWQPGFVKPSGALLPPVEI